MERNTPKEKNQTEQQTGVPIESDNPTNMTGTTALPETTVPRLHEIVVEEPDTMLKQTQIIKMRKMRQFGQQRKLKPLRLPPTTNPNIKVRRTKAYNLNKIWKLLPVMKL